MSVEDIRRQNEERRARTHCPAGHPYNAENTYGYGNERRCKMCRRASQRYNRRIARSRVKPAPTASRQPRQGARPTYVGERKPLGKPWELYPELGRPRQYPTPEITAKVAAATRLGMSYAGACRLAGIQPETGRLWLERGGELMEMLFIVQEILDLLERGEK